MKKRRNRICRRIAVALTVALLVGQSHAFVLAEEGAGDAPQTEISSGETGTDNPGGNVDSQPPKDGKGRMITGISRTAKTERTSVSAGRSARKTL